MSLSSVLTTLVAVLGLANLVLAVRLTNRCGDERREPGGEGVNGVAAPPPPAIGDHGTVAPDRRT
ncbi:hypothetical protein [Catenulispora pinisilvae]|uniref:hypothetical protein n=1 Tax=Catenulispora pinisilvae TaxID=2705253 RepID=UPI0018920FDF|nr:hypothetical protein [Catenulispora pinisilvae]